MFKLVKKVFGSNSRPKSMNLPEVEETELGPEQNSSENTFSEGTKTKDRKTPMSLPEVKDPLPATKAESISVLPAQIDSAPKSQEFSTDNFLTIKERISDESMQSVENLSFEAVLDNERLISLSIRLNTFSALKTLTLSYNSFTDGGLICFAAHLEKNTTIVSLKLENNSECNMVHLFSFLEANATLQELKLRNNHVTAKSLKHLAEALKANDTLTTLDLSFNELDDNAAFIIAEIIKNNSSLTKIDLTGNLISDKGAKAIAEALEYNDTIKELLLEKNKLTENCTDTFESALNNTSLTLLKSDHIEIHKTPLIIGKQEEDQEDFVKYTIKKQTHNNGKIAPLILTVENSSQTSTISDENIAVLIDILKQYPELKILNLSCNHFSNNALKLLLNAINEHTTLTTLNLSSNQLDDDAIDLIAAMLRNNTSLTQLDLTENYFGDKGATALDTALDHTALTILILDNNKIEDKKIVASMNRKLGLEIKLQKSQDTETTKNNSHSATEISSNEGQYTSKVLGSGNWSKVYSGTIGGDQEIAIKTFNKKIKPGYEAYIFRLIRREIAMLAQLDHPNIVKFFGTSKIDDFFCIVMERMEKNLHKILEEILEDPENNTPTWELRLKWAKEIAAAIAYLHNLGIVHGDIKNPNILIKNYTAKLADFGEAQHESTITTGEQHGTIIYMAPELLNKKSSNNKKTDTFSFGKVLHSLLFKANPEQRSPTTFDKKEKLPQSMIRCSEIAKKCLDESPNDRPDSKDVDIELNSLRP